MYCVQKLALILSTVIIGIFAQDYDVSDIQCTFSSQGSTEDSITAILRKPSGFKGTPLFADDRTVNPDTDRICSIEKDRSDPSEQLFNLKILDFTKCGVLKRNGFVHVRIWFPQFPGVVMQSDQELIIMCKPPEPTIIQNKAAGFAGSFPHGARVSGVVEETPGRLEYEVALYKEAPPSASTVNGNPILGLPHHLKNQSNQINELPLDQAVPIGTKLQLRARISHQSVWKYVKLMEVTVSPDADNPHALGSVSLVRDGCRNRDFSTIIPHQPARYRERPNEVFLDFEAFLLSSMKERSTLWIHSQIKACMEAADCQPDFCLDLYEPSGHGRRRRDVSNSSLTEYTKFKENIEYTVIMPGDYNALDVSSEQCKHFVLISLLLAVLLAFATILGTQYLYEKKYYLETNYPSQACTLVFKIQSIQHKTINDLKISPNGYSGRATVQ